MRSLADQISLIDKTLASVDKRLTSLAVDDNRVQLLCSFSGIAALSATGLLLNMPSFATLKDASSLAAYWGLHPVYQESGDGRKVPHMSKAGRSQPRAILFMVTMSAIGCNPHIKELCRKQVYTRNKSRLSAIGVCMHRIARIVYGMLRTGTTFDPNHTEATEARRSTPAPEEMMRAEEQRRRRFEPANAQAPISLREMKKREKLNGPQRAQGTKNEVTSSASPTREYASVVT